MDPLTSDNDIVYRPWPEPTIRTELDVFRNAMFGGADADALSAGLLSLDFLTRASDMTPTTRTLVEMTVSEARMRIDLMVAADQTLVADADVRHKALLARVRHLGNGLNSVQRLIDSIKAIDPDELKLQVDAHIQRREGRFNRGGKR